MALSRREEEVAGLVADGLSNLAIAGRLFISERTVETHVQRVLNKLGFDRRSQIAAWVATNRASPGRVQLPTPLTSFVGRAHEVKEVRRLLEHRRLVTLTGPGGVGKTRLAIAVANMSGRFSRVFFVDLSVVEATDRVLAEIAQVVAESSAAEEEALIGRLNQAVSLLVIDNCEHLLQPVSGLVTLLLQKTRVVVLATSRAPLEVESEVVYAVQPLAEAEAIELFQDRAQIDAAADDAAAICRRIDQLPLAVELAAARTRVMSVRAIAQSLDQSLELLAMRRAPTTIRHSSMDACIRWSYERLEPAQQALLVRLAVFPGAFGLDLAAAVCTATKRQLLELVDLSLVARKDDDSYRLLNTIRQFAREQLEESGQEAALRGRLAGAFSDLLERHSDDLIAVDDLAIQEVKREVDSIHVVMDELSRADPARFVRAVNLSRMALYRSGRYREERDLLARARDLQSGSRFDRAHVNCGFAHLEALLGGNLDEAAEAAELAIELFEGEGDQAGLIRSLTAKAHVESERGDFRAAESLLKRALLIDGEAPTGRRANILYNLALYQVAAGSYIEAERHAREAIAIADVKHSLSWKVAGLIGLACALTGMSRVEEALDFAREAVRLQLAGYGPRGGTTLITCAAVALGLGDLEKAATLTAAAKTLDLQLGLRTDYAGNRFITDILTRVEGSNNATVKKAQERGRRMARDDALRYALELG